MPSRWDEKQQKWVTTRKTKAPTNLPTEHKPLEPMGKSPPDARTPRPIGPPASPTPTQTRGHGKRGMWYWSDPRKPKETEQGE